jgi:hypothetical protein
MDGMQIDGMARSLGRRGTRRGALKALASAALAGLLGRVAAGEAAAKSCAACPGGTLNLDTCECVCASSCPAGQVHDRNCDCVCADGTTTCLEAPAVVTSPPPVGVMLATPSGPRSPCSRTHGLCKRIPRRWRQRNRKRRRKHSR